MYKINAKQHMQCLVSAYVSHKCKHTFRTQMASFKFVQSKLNVASTHPIENLPVLEVPH